MKSIVLISFLALSIAFVYSQVCQNPKPSSTCNTKDLGGELSKAWFFYSSMSSIESPFSYTCARGVCNNNDTHVSIRIRGKKNNETERVMLTLKSTPTIGKYQAEVDRLVFAGVEINNTQLDFYGLHCERAFWSIYIVGRIAGGGMSVSFVTAVILTPTPNITEAQYKTAQEKFSGCNMNRQWKRVNHDPSICKGILGAQSSQG